MAKVPVAGTVKTRLAPFLSSEKCAELATAFLLDAERKAKSICKKTILAYSPADQTDVLGDILRFENILIEQTGATLGERMSNAFEFAFAAKSDAVVMIGTDSPTFSADFIELAFEYLENKADVVLGKSADGGFYLIGLQRKNYPELFENVVWSSPSVFAQTIANAAQLNLRLKEIPAWYDVDTPDDLLILRDEILGDKPAQKSAPATYQWFRRNLFIFANRII